MGSVSAHPPVDVVIPHYRNIRSLERCLCSLGKTHYPSLNVLVVDNGGASGLSEIVAHFPGVRLLELSGNQGYAGGCNAGFHVSVAEFVVFMNDDTLHDPFWLDELIDAAQSDERVAALQPKILSLQEREKGRSVFDYAGAAGGMIDRFGYPWCLGRSFFGVEDDTGQYDAPREIFWASGAAMLVRRKLFLEVGGFDDSFFMHMEEIDLCWRFRLAGYRVRSVPSSVVYHEGGASLAHGSPVKSYYNHRNNLRMLVKNLQIGSLAAVLFVRLLLEPVAALFYLLKRGGGIAEALSVARAFFDVVGEMPHLIRCRRAVQATRRRSDRELFSGMPLSVLLRR